MRKTQSALKKILLLHTGGTIAMGSPNLKSKNSGTLTIDRNFIKHLKQWVPELWDIANLDVRLVSNKDSSQITVKDWIYLYEIIQQATSRYDGFVITHGTDTMVFTGTALSYLLPYPCKPVVLTGSQRPLQELRTDAKRNLLNSVAYACSDKNPEVSLFFDTLLLRANRSKKIHIEDFHTFASPNFLPFAEEKLKTKFYPIKPELIRRPKWLANWLERTGASFDSRIQVFKAFPGLNPEVSAHAQAILIEAFGCGNLPLVNSSILTLLKKCQRQKIPVILTSQVPAGSLAPETYQMGKKALQLGAISSHDMTFEAALIKTMILAGNRVAYQNWPQFFQANWAGEISSRD